MDDGRYSRLTRFQKIGEKGLKALRNSRVAIVGVGTLGALHAETLVRNGVGHLTLIDRDVVEMSNLLRQHLYTESDALENMPKAWAAKTRLEAINQEGHIDSIISDLNSKNAEEILTGHDVILDGTDNFETRLLINDVAVKHDIPWIYGAATGSYGATFTVIPGLTPCFSCLYQKIPLGGETCETVGILTPAAQIIAAMQVTEVMKIITKQSEQLRTGYYYTDVWSNETSNIATQGLKSAACPTCGETADFPFLKGTTSRQPALLCGRDTVQILPNQAHTFNYHSVVEHLEKTDNEIITNDFLTRLQLGDQRLVLFHDGRALIHGTHEISKAKALYNRFIGG